MRFGDWKPNLKRVYIVISCINKLNMLGERETEGLYVNLDLPVCVSCEKERFSDFFDEIVCNDKRMDVTSLIELCTCMCVLLYCVM